MFTGLIESVAGVVSLHPAEGGGRLTLVCPGFADKVTLGESVSVNGACLTVAWKEPPRLVFDVSSETLRRTAFSRLRPGHRVNLERAVRMGDRLGGHIVNGHVDGTGRVLEMRPSGGFALWRVEIEPALVRYVAEKGCIAIDGVSLTVAGIEGNTFTVALIPATLAQTALLDLRAGDAVNIEVDVLAKYVERLLSGQSPVATRTESLETALREHGFLA